MDPWTTLIDQKFPRQPSTSHAEFGGRHTATRLLPALGSGCVGLRALQYAAMRGNETSIELLCLHDADVNQPCVHDGNTPLHLAAQYGQYSAVRLAVRLSVYLPV